MINLLPPELKKQIKAAKNNSLLMRYCVLSIILLFLLSAMIGGVYLMMDQSKKSAETTIEESNTKRASYAKVQQEVDNFQKNLATAKTILDKEVKYTNVTLKIAQSLPPGIVLDSLQLDATSFGQPITLNAKGKSYDDALSLKSSLENKPEIFQNVHLQTVSRGEDGQYPVTITINVTISQEITKS